MSDTALQGVQLTGNEAVDREKQDLAGLEQQLTELRKTNPALFGQDSPQNTAPPPIELEVGGRKVVFDSPEKIKETLEGLTGYIQQLEQRVNAPAAQVPAQVPPEKRGFTDEEFAERLKTKGTQEALSYWFENSPLYEKQRQLEAELSQLRQKDAVNSFASATKDYDPQNFQKVRQIAAALKFDMSNPVHLAAAYALGKEQGMINSGQQPSFNPQNPYPTAPRPVVPPTMGRAAYGDDNSARMITDFSKLPLDQMESVLTELQRSGR